MKYTDLTTKTARIDYIRSKLEVDYGWAVRGLKRIYEHQTASEQNCQSTHELNGVGFTGVDGEILSSFAEQVIKGRTLSLRQQSLLFKKMPKYAKQLQKISENKQ